MKAMSWIWAQGAWKFFLFIGMLIMFGCLVKEVLKGDFETAHALPMLAILGIVTMLGALLIFTTLLNVVGLSDQTQALGLPEGSVRALLALSLLGLFAILASSMLAKPELRTFAHLTAEDLLLLIKNNPDARDLVQKPEAADPKFYSGHFYTPVKHDDFVKQMLTFVGTLMTAVIAFYFGTSATRAPVDLTLGPPNVSSVIAVTKLPTIGPVTLDVKGSNMNNVGAAQLTEPTQGLQLNAHTVVSNASQVTCTFGAHPALNAKATWDVTVVDNMGRAATKKGGLVVELPAGQPTAVAPVVSAVTPATAKQNEATPYTLSGTGLDGVSTVQAIPVDGGNAVLAQNIQNTASQLTCSLTLPAGSWTVRIAPGTVAAGVGQIIVT